MKKPIIALFLFGLLFFMPTGSVSAEEPIDYKLAVIDAQGPVAKDDIKVTRFRSLLDQLSATYVESKQQIADMTVFAQKDLRKSSIEESMLNMMEGMNQLFSRKVENQKYAEYLSSYLILRMKGQSHAQAFAGLKAILNAMGIR